MIVFWSFLIALVQSYDLSYFPDSYATPPVNLTLSKILLGGASIPNISIRAEGGPTDW
jgi:hypothetical protein